MGRRPDCRFLAAIGQASAWACCATLIGCVVTAAAAATPPTNPASYEPIRIVGTDLSDDGDDDGWADTRETVRLRLKVWNRSGADLSGLVARLSTSSPEIACITHPTLIIGDLAAGATRWTSATFGFVVADVERVSTSQTLSADFAVQMFADSFIALLDPARITIDLDLDAAPGSGRTAYFESFEDGLGTFSPMHLDADLNPPDSDLNNFAAGVANADGYRCQHSDPDWEGSTSSGNYNGQADVCFPNPNGAPDVFYFARSFDRAFSGGSSLYYGVPLAAPLGLSTPTAQLEAIATTAPVNIDYERGCSESWLTTCGHDADCPAGEICVRAAPFLSFKHQVSLQDQRTSRNVDRGVVMAQEADAQSQPLGPWFKLTPLQHGYDSQIYYYHAECKFDPIDDGNTEEDFFYPEDPDRMLGPSSTCYPEYAYFYLGDTDSRSTPATWGGPRTDPVLRATRASVPGSSRPSASSATAVGGFGCASSSPGSSSAAR